MRQRLQIPQGMSWQHPSFSLASSSSFCVSSSLSLSTSAKSFIFSSVEPKASLDFSVRRALASCLMVSWTRRSSLRPISFSLALLGRRAFSRKERTSRFWSHNPSSWKFVPSSSHTSIRWHDGFGLGGEAWLKGARPSDCECFVGASIVFLLLLKTSPEVVSLSFSVRVETVMTGALSLRSWGAWAATLILLALSARSFLSIRASMLSTKGDKRKLEKIIRSTSSRVENEKYWCKLLEPLERTLCVWEWRCQILLLSLRERDKPPGHAGAYLPGAEHLGSMASGSSIEEIHPEGLDPSYYIVSSRIFLWSPCKIVGRATTMLSQPLHWKTPKVGGLGVWPQRNIKRLQQMAKGQTVCKEWKNFEQMVSYLGVIEQRPH